MIIDGHNLPCYFADGFCTQQDFIGRLTKIEDRYWIETGSFVYSPHQTKLDPTSGIKGKSYHHVHAPQTHTKCT